MTRTHRSLLATAALALTLPSLVSAQDATTEPMAEGAVTDVQATSAAEPMDLSTWTYDDIYANGISVEQIIGSDIYGPDGDDVGDVDNVLFDMDGRVLSIVARVGGGFLGIGTTHVNIPWDMVSAEAWADGLVIPFTADQVDDYTVQPDLDDGTIVGSQEVAEVAGGAFQDVETGPDVWRATDLLNNAARLREGEDYANHGMITDLILRDGEVAAVVVTPDAGFGTGEGAYGYPFAGTAAWNRGTGMGMGGATDGTAGGMAADGTTVSMTEGGTYDLPYDRVDAERLQPFDPMMLRN